MSQTLSKTTTAQHSTEHHSETLYTFFCAAMNVVLLNVAAPQQGHILKTLILSLK
jgi:hypothetical protein